MAIYFCEIEGSGLRFEVDDKIEDHGFVVARHVNAPSKELAERAAKHLVREELREKFDNPETADLCELKISKIYAADPSDSTVKKKTGFIFFPTEENSKFPPGVAGYKIEFEKRKHWWQFWRK